MKCCIDSLEYNVVWTCTNSCASCSHFSPVNPVNNVDPESFEKCVITASRTIHAKMFTLLGGEPLIHPSVVDLIWIARKAGIAEQVQVTTNGKLLDKQPDAFWDALQGQALRVTRYPGTVSEEQWSRWKSRSAQLGIYFHGGMNAKFYRPISLYELTPTEAQARFDQCPWKSHCTTLHESRLFRCPQAVFMPIHFQGVGKPDDGLCMEQACAEDVAKYMMRSNALDVCRLCSYTSYAAWKQVQRSQWFEESIDA
jgi:hypothetical protein